MLLDSLTAFQKHARHGPLSGETPNSLRGGSARVCFINIQCIQHGQGYDTELLSPQSSKTFSILQTQSAQKCAFIFSRSVLGRDQTVL